MSLPYHIGNGWFGGFLPPTAFAIVAATGNIYSGLWYPIVIAAMTFVIGLLFVPRDEGPRHLHLRGREALSAAPETTNESPGASRGFFLGPSRGPPQRQVVTRRTIQPSSSTQSFFRAVKQLPSSPLPIAAVVAASSPSAGLPPPLCIAVKAAFGDFSAFWALPAHRAAGNKEDRREGERGGRERGPRAGVAFHGGYSPGSPVEAWFLVPL